MEHEYQFEVEGLGLPVTVKGETRAEAEDKLRAADSRIAPMAEIVLSAIDGEECEDDDSCDECGGINNDGEGYDGRCGDCADRREASGEFDDE